MPNLDNLLIVATMSALRQTEKQELLTILITKGRLFAIKKYMKLTGCGPYDARCAIDKIALEIEPGPTK